MATITEPQIAEDLLPQLNALIGAHYLELACFTLLVYDYLITLSQEVEYFWTGSWTPSRILFLLNRYIPFCLMIAYYLDPCFFSNRLTFPSCTHASRTIFYSSIPRSTPAILLLRVWYMFPYSVLARTIASSSYAACTMASLALTGENIHGLRSTQTNWGPGITIPGCSAPPASGLWKSFIPTMVIHSVLYGFTVIRAMKQPWMAPRAPLLMRLLREGGLVYFVAMVSAIFSAVGARLTTIPSVNYPAYSNLTLAVNAVAVSRLMLSARSLAGKLRTDPRWLLNPTELGRVGWRYAEDGAETYGYEIMVARDTFEPEMNGAEVGSISTGEPSLRNRSHLWGL
ncbi:hypothetical protein BDN67DRAFT_899504 [Paxillus ammoniavirescens]|nr:hypothetical protein BDN67DRAFT_899504 [Paxillus ammoniavirescens]